MKSRHDFCRELASLKTTQVDRAIALLWYYRQSQQFEERSPSELAADLHDEGFPRPNPTRLRDDLRKNKFAVRGKRKGTCQLNLKHIADLDSMYIGLLGSRPVEVKGDILPVETVAGTRSYLEQMVYQINGAYESGFYDACAVLCRRLMESLIIEVYISKKRQHEIQRDGVFLYLDKLVTYISNDKTLNISRNSPKTMQEIKQLGDTAAHDRVYITQQGDIDDTKARYRRLINDLLVASGIKK